MSQAGSVSRWIGGLKEGKDSAAHNIWDRYKGRMHAVAGSKLGNSSRAVSDEEDVVICAFMAFLRRTSQGAYPLMQNRDDLWRLLAAITQTYAWKQSRFLGRLRRHTTKNKSLTSSRILSQLASGSPPPDVLASVSEVMRVLLDRLDEPELREVALGRLNGLTNEEIAAKQNRSVRTIERRLVLIRAIWAEQQEQS